MKDRWESKASNLLKAELARRGLSYEELKVALEKIGVIKSVSNINKPINLGKFSFAFFLQCAEAIELETIHL